MNNFDNLCEQILKSGVFSTTEEVFRSLVSEPSSQGKIKVQKENGEFTEGDYVWNNESKHFSINWEEDNQEYGVDFNPADRPNTYPFFKNENSITVEWSPGEKITVLKS